MPPAMPPSTRSSWLRVRRRPGRGGGIGCDGGGGRRRPSLSMSMITSSASVPVAAIGDDPERPLPGGAESGGVPDQRWRRSMRSWCDDHDGHPLVGAAHQRAPNRRRRVGLRARQRRAGARRPRRVRAHRPARHRRGRLRIAWVVLPDDAGEPPILRRLAPHDPIDVAAVIAVIVGALLAVARFGFSLPGSIVFPIVIAGVGLALLLRWPGGDEEIRPADLPEWLPPAAQEAVGALGTRRGLWCGRRSARSSCSAASPHCSRPRRRGRACATASSRCWWWSRPRVRCSDLG